MVETVRLVPMAPGRTAHRIRVDAAGRRDRGTVRSRRSVARNRFSLAPVPINYGMSVAHCSRSTVLLRYFARIRPNISDTKN